jgi:hypothetical protein
VRHFGDYSIGCGISEPERVDPSDKRRLYDDQVRKVIRNADDDESMA